ncbi:MAG TPA: hypothetical protein VGN20_05260 [Mucilaginibacter sp.]|jgi:hypothetical protein
MKRYCIVLLSVIFCSFQSTTSLKGTYEFVGGIYNGKKEGAPAGYVLNRKYDNTKYQAFMVEKGYKPEKYEAGKYSISGDTCIDTETYSSQPSKIINIPISYSFTLKNDTLTFKGTLPTGMKVEEYWKKVK